MLGPPLLERSQAHAIGLKARREAGKLKEDVARARKAPLSAARKLDDTDPQRQLLLDEADKKEADLRGQLLTLPFPIILYSDFLRRETLYSQATYRVRERERASFHVSTLYLYCVNIVKATKVQ